MGVHRTCGEPDEIGLTPMGVEMNGPRCVRGGRDDVSFVRAADDTLQLSAIGPAP